MQLRIKKRLRVALAIRWGSIDPHHRDAIKDGIFEPYCPQCNDAGCAKCGGSGRFRIGDQTPAQFAGAEAFHIIDVADFWAKGMPYHAGGQGDQQYDLAQAVLFCWQDEAYYKRKNYGKMADIL